MTILCLKGKHEYPVFCLAFICSEMLGAQSFLFLMEVFCLAMTANATQQSKVHLAHLAYSCQLWKVLS